MNVVIKPHAGSDVSIDPGAILRIIRNASIPRAPDVGPSFAGATRVDTDDAANLLIFTDSDVPTLATSCLANGAPLVKLTAPDGSPVWVNRTKLKGVRQPRPDETGGPPPQGMNARACFQIGKVTQFVQETVDQVKAAIGMA